MANMIIKMKIMPEDVEVDMNEVLDQCKKVVLEQEGEIHQHEIQPIAFGLNALILVILIDEKKGTTHLEEAINNLPLVSGGEIMDLRRAFG